jgi:hypothetical protein
MTLPRVDHVPARTARLRARAPRVALFLAVGLLALAGLRQIIAPVAPTPTLASREDEAADPRMELRGYAEAFARAYFTWDVKDPEMRIRALASFVGASDLGEDAGLSLPERGGQVVWTAPVSERRVGVGWRVRVALQMRQAGAIQYLEVPLARDGKGALFVSDLPAFVSAPSSTPPTRRPELFDLNDDALTETAARATLNYLARDETQLAADTLPGLSIAPPPLAAKKASVTRLGWLDPEAQLVGVDVSVPLPGGAIAELRYEVSVIHSGRWFVRAIGPP